jgi:PAS domain S-box-containing protein
VAIAVVTVSVLAVVNAITGPDLIMLGLLVAGPCLAAASASPRAVIAVGVYASLLILALSWWPDRLWGTAHQVLYLLSVLVVTAVSTIVARRHRVFEDLLGQSNSGRRQLAAIVESSDDAIITKTLDGVITSWNPGAERMYGYQSAEAVGNYISMIVGPVEASELLEIMARLRRGERIDHYETQRFCKDGTVKEVSVTMSPVRDDAGNVTGASAVARDISERKQADARQHLVEESSQQAQRLQSLGQLAGGIAHDFNNLLAVIGSHADFVAEQTTNDSSVQADIATIRTATERATTLTRQLLVFARGEIQQTTTFDLNAAVGEAQQVLAPTIGEHIEWVSIASPTALMIHADRGQIQQILINLALNARDAMPDGGTLVIETASTEIDATLTDPHLVLTPGSYAKLSVSDTGAGMSAEITAHIFEPFFTTKPRDQATGLGLAIVHGIVSQTGGDIGVYTEPNLGTTFRVYLPTANQPSTRADIQPAAQPPRGHGQTILVVEDEDAIRQLVERILAKNGFATLGASRGHQALTIADQRRCDLLLTDVVMPEMSGPRLAELMRERHPGVPVLFMSGYTDGLLATRGDVGGTELIQKPFTASDLLHKVDAALTRAGTEAPVGSPTRPAQGGPQ